MELLEHEADAPPAQRGEAPVAEPADVVTVDAHRPLRRPLQGPDDVDQRRLPRPRRADDDDELAGADREVDPGEGLDRRLAGVALDDAVHLQHRVAAPPPYTHTPTTPPSRDDDLIAGRQVADDLDHAVGEHAELDGDEFGARAGGRSTA